MVALLARAGGRGGQQIIARDRQRRRAELIGTSCLVFAEKGFDGATLQDIADRFGVLKGSLFHYIQSKDDLLYEIIDGVCLGAEDAIWAITQEAGTAAARLRRLTAAYVRYVTDHQPAVTVLLHDLGALEPARRRLILKREEQNRQRLISLIAAAQQEGGVRADVDPGLAAFALLGAMNWVHRWFPAGGGSAADIGREFSRIFFELP